jgi:hypothetical protein
MGKAKEVLSSKPRDRGNSVSGEILANLSNSFTPAKAGVKECIEKTGFRLSPE